MKGLGAGQWFWPSRPAVICASAELDGSSPKLISTTMILLSVPTSSLSLIAGLQLLCLEML